MMARTITAKGTPRPIPTLAEELKPGDAAADKGSVADVVGGVEVEVLEDEEVEVDAVADAEAGGVVVGTG